MRKKVLVITLALVLAFASSAMAGVSFGGSFEVKFEQEGFKFFKEGYTLAPDFGFNINASNNDKTEDVLNWEFNTEVKRVGEEWQQGKYRLGLYDQYFKAWVWGKGFELSDKATHFGMISAGKAAADIRSRVEVPVGDVTVVADFDKDTMRAFVNGSIEGYNLGFAYQLGDWVSEDPAHIVVGQVDGDIPAGDLDLGFKAAIGASLGDDTGFAFGVELDADVTDELNVTASVTNANEHWTGAGPAEETTVLAADATYTEENFRVKAGFKHTAVKGEDGSTGVDLGAIYRMGTLAYDQLFHSDHWFKTDAPAFGASINIADMKFGNATLNASSPVVDDLAWVWANAKFVDKDEYSAKLLGYVAASDKLTLKPSAEYDKDEDGKVFDLALNAVYKIADNGPNVNFGINQKFEGGEATEGGVTASVKVTF